MRRLLTGLTLTACATCAIAQTGTPRPAPAAPPSVTVTEPPAPLLPTNAQLVAPDAADASVLPADKPELAAILKEDGLVRQESRIAKVPIAQGSATSGWVTAYQFGDATGALSAFTYLRQGGRPFGTGSGDTKPAEYRLPNGERVVLSGVTVVRLATRQYPESENGLLASVELGLPKIGGRRAAMPLLPTMLPKAGLEADSVRYALGPAGYQAMGGVLPAGNLGWDKALETATATYTGKGGSKGTLTLLLYPTPQIAGDRGRAIEKEVNDAGGKTAFGTVRMRRVGPLVGFTSGALTAAQAGELVGALHLTQDLSYDKPMPLEFHAEVQKTASLLENIAVLCGVLILAAILLGLFLGGARAGWRVMHGKSAASEPEFLTISLRGEPKGLFVPKDEKDKTAV